MKIKYRIKTIEETRVLDNYDDGDTGLPQNTTHEVNVEADTLTECLTRAFRYVSVDYHEDPALIKSGAEFSWVHYEGSQGVVASEDENYQWMDGKIDLWHVEYRATVDVVLLCGDMTIPLPESPEELIPELANRCSQ